MIVWPNSESVLSEFNAIPVRKYTKSPIGQSLCTTRVTLFTIPAKAAPMVKKRLSPQAWIPQPKSLLAWPSGTSSTNHYLWLKPDSSYLVSPFVRIILRIKRRPRCNCASTGSSRTCRSTCKLDADAGIGSPILRYWHVWCPIGRSIKGKPSSSPFCPRLSVATSGPSAVSPPT